MTVSPEAGVSTSPTVTLTLVEESSLIVRLPMAETTGASFTAVMFTVKTRVVMLFDAALSLTVTVIVAVPLELGDGVKETVPIVGVPAS